ncbi:MAG: tripartite tricarboxylate transporter substrate binding protein [Betaproteobacteria bacterium]|nr:tripartite tricarboxylate transporter substrate binding protein [Betaproteobacteria bacterium]MBI2959697.1 tripartite tricarboxylate transporter substrate binding protein [Betaproteobacteria bacterium]
MQKCATTLALAWLFAAAGSALAQEWPQKTVRIINPFAAGTSTDVVGRVIAEGLQKRLGKPFIVETRTGAGGMIGTAEIARADPDGHTIGVSIPGPLAINVALYKKMPYDPFRDLAPITLAVHQPCVLVASPALRVADVRELFAEFKKQPGKYNYALSAVGGTAHLVMAMLMARSGTRLEPILYPGATAAITAIISGDVHVGCFPAVNMVGQVKAGKVLGLGVSSAKRIGQLPEVSTLVEQGFPGVVGSAWIGVVAPIKTPKPLLEAISREVIAALRQPAAIEILSRQVMEVVANTPEEFNAFRRQEIERWKPVIEQYRISLEAPESKR